eukprot:1252825-Pyramimonas_sp.AAC.1
MEKYGLESAGPPPLLRSVKVFSLKFPEDKVLSHRCPTNAHFVTSPTITKLSFHVNLPLPAQCPPHICPFPFPSLTQTTPPPLALRDGPLQRA